MLAPASVLVLLAQFLERGRGPEQSGDFEVSPNLFFAIFGIGLLVGALGHLFRSRTMVAIGVTLVFLSTFAIPIVLQATR